MNFYVNAHKKNANQKYQFLHKEGSWTNSLVITCAIFKNIINTYALVRAA